MHKKIHSLLILILLVPAIAIATPKKKSKSKKKPNESFADHAHRVLSGSVLSFANRLDNFFGTDRANIEQNKTRLRIFVDTFKYEGQDPVMEGNIKLQLVLPNTQNRLRFVFESSEDKDEQAASKATPTATATTRTRGERLRETTTIGLRYILDAANIRSSVGSGVKFDELSPRPFIRLRFMHDNQFGRWLFRPRHEFLWVASEGISSDTDANFDTPLNDDWLFRIVNNMQWNDTDYITNFQDGISFFHTLSDKIGMSYNAHTFTERSGSTWAVTNYSLNVGYRQLLYKDWFFWTLAPALNFPRVENFHRTPSLTVRFEVVIGYI